MPDAILETCAPASAPARSRVAGASEPAVGEILFDAATGEHVTVMGPVGIVREVERSSRRRWREYFDLWAILASYLWPGSPGVELFLTTRGRGSKVDPPPERK